MEMFIKQTQKGYKINIKVIQMQRSSANEMIY